MDSYTVNLSKQLEILNANGVNGEVLFEISIKKDRRVRNGNRNVIVVSPSKKKNSKKYKMDEKGNIEIPKNLVKKVSSFGGKLIYGMISPVDDGVKKILVPWLDDQGNF